MSPFDRCEMLTHYRVFNVLFMARAEDGSPPRQVFQRLACWRGLIADLSFSRARPHTTHMTIWMRDQAVTQTLSACTVIENRYTFNLVLVCGGCGYCCCHLWVGGTSKTWQESYIWTLTPRWTDHRWLQCYGHCWCLRDAGLAVTYCYILCRSCLVWAV